MTRRMWIRRLVALTGAVALGGLGLAAASSGRPDCPGQIVCPLTGQLVCKDRCPLGDTDTKNTDTGAKPSCCRQG